MEIDLEPAFRNFLGQLGLLGIRKGLAREGELMFLGLQALDETRIGPAIGLAQAYMADDRHREAAAVLEEAARVDLDACLYYAMALHLSGRENKARELWNKLSTRADHVGASARAFMLVSGIQLVEKKDNEQ